MPVRGWAYLQEGYVLSGEEPKAAPVTKAAPATKVAPVPADAPLRLGIDSFVDSLDPYATLSIDAVRYAHLVFDPLVRWGKDMALEPRLAVSWEWVGARTLRFHLRKGVRFHSGNPFTARDVQWTLERIKTSASHKWLFEPFERATVVDDHIVDITTGKASALLPHLAAYLFPMDSAFHTGRDASGQDKARIATTGSSFAGDHESGTGRYAVARHEAGGTSVFKAFPGYWDTQSPGNVGEIVLTLIPTGADRVAALLEGRVDAIGPVSSQDRDRLKAGKNVKVATVTGSRIITLQLNRKRRSEFADPRVRQAIVYATNNQGIVDTVMRGDATAAGQQSPLGFAGHDPALAPRYDLEKARRLMREAGYPNGFSCTMIAPNDRYVNDAQVAEAFVAMMAKIGIKVALSTMPKAQYWDRFDAGAADIQMIGWVPDTGDSANYSEWLLMCPDKENGYGQYNSGNYCNPAFDKLILASRTETDWARRAAMLQQAERMAYEDAAFVPLHWQRLSWAGRRGVGLEAVLNAMDLPYWGDLVME